MYQGDRIMHHVIPGVDISDEYPGLYPESVTQS